jgi:hypothetical protein
MVQMSAALFRIRSDSGLLFFTACVFALLAYELLSGNIIGIRWNVWATRKDRPGIYWAAVSIKVAYVLFVAYVFLG